MTDPDTGPDTGPPTPAAAHLIYDAEGVPLHFAAEGECPTNECQPEDGIHVEPYYGVADHWRVGTHILVAMHPQVWAEITAIGPILPDDIPSEVEGLGEGRMVTWMIHRGYKPDETADKHRAAHTQRPHPEGPSPDAEDPAHGEGQPAGPLVEDMLAIALRGRSFETIEVAGWFACAHLPDQLQAISAMYAENAVVLLEWSPDGPNLLDALHCLLRAKDAAVRSCAGPLGVAKQVRPDTHQFHYPEHEGAVVVTSVGPHGPAKAGLMVPPPTTL